MAIIKSLNWHARRTSQTIPSVARNAISHGKENRGHEFIFCKVSVSDKAGSRSVHVTSLLVLQKSITTCHFDCSVDRSSSQDHKGKTP